MEAVEAEIAHIRDTITLMMVDDGGQAREALAKADPGVAVVGPIRRVATGSRFKQLLRKRHRRLGVPLGSAG